jgi:hypothetical protein
MNTSHWALMVGAIAVTGCSGGEDGASRPAGSAGMMHQMDSAGMGMGHMDSGGMGMGGMNMQGMAMMPGMRAHMDSMVGMSSQQMQAMMATHQGMMSRMMDGMGADMRGMQMSGSPAWTALADSVKRDLAELPGLEGKALTARMRAHAERARRLMAMHEQMMGK